jgi:hypothetical protein
MNGSLSSRSSSTYGDQIGVRETWDQRGVLHFFFTSSLFHFFSDDGVASGFPYCVCPLLPLHLPGIIVACVHAMAGLYFIKIDNLFEELILAPT